MLKAAVIGCGKMGAEPSNRVEGKIPSGWTPISHAESFIQAENVVLTAFAEVNIKRLRWAGENYGIRSLFKDHKELFREVKPEIIGVATRTPDKIEIMQDACNSGIKGIYVEKPIANNLFDAKHILNLAKTTNTIVSYGVNRRYHSVYRQARELIRLGEIGNILEVIIEFGESPLMWTHPHSVDLMIFLTEQSPIEVQAELLDSTVLKKSNKKIDSDPVISYAKFWFDGGAVGLILRGAGFGVRVNGTKGSLEIFSDGAAIQIRKSFGQATGYFLSSQLIMPLSQRSATVIAIEELVKMINGEKIFSISHNEIYLGMQMLWGCVLSHFEGGKKCLLVNIPEDLLITGRFGKKYA